jgi:hypothetical protein
MSSSSQKRTQCCGACCACSEPEALPFCALAYALMGIISTVLVALPPVARALLAITA